MPPSTSPIILVLGAGPNIGHHVARTFAAGGYRVVLAARSVKEADSTDSQLNIPSDFTKVEDVVNAFERVKRVFGVPNVVVYNVSASTRTPPDEPFSLPLIDFQHDLTINITSLYVAAQQAVAGFAQRQLQLPPATTSAGGDGEANGHVAPSAPALALTPTPSPSPTPSPTPTFIVTGNILNVETIPGFISQGVGKSAGAHMMWAAANAYNAKGYKFYYADERKADGTAKYRVDGDAHAQLSKSLAEDKSQREWHQTFVMGKGYQKFASSL